MNFFSQFNIHFFMTSVTYVFILIFTTVVLYQTYQLWWKGQGHLNIEDREKEEQLKFNRLVEEKMKSLNHRPEFNKSSSTGDHFVNTSSVKKSSENITEHQHTPRWVDNLCATFQFTPEDLKEKVFLPFFTTFKKGTGLGLAICRRLVQINGGVLELESKVGQGTTIKVIFDHA